MQRIKGVVAGILVGVPFGLYLNLWLHATREFSIVAPAGIGVAIFAIVATRSDSNDEAADAAWRAAALDLPPTSDRVILERLQASMPGPDRKRRSISSKGGATAGPTETAAGGGHPA